MLEQLFDIYLIVNAVGFGMMIWVVAELGEFLLYPLLWGSLECSVLNDAGKVTLCALITLLFAPSIIIWHLSVALIYGLYKLFIFLFRKR